MDSLAAAAAITFAFLLAGVVKGVLGMGLPTIAMGVLGIFLAPAQAAAVLIVPTLVTNIWQLVAGPRLLEIARRFATMMIGILLGTFGGIGVLTSDSVGIANAALGTALAIYGAISLAAVRFDVPPERERWLSPVIGVTTGLLAGATGVFGVPAIPYFSSLRLEREEMIQTLGLSFTVSTVALALALATRGVFRPQLAVVSLLAVLPALIGMWVGQKLRYRLDPIRFRRWFLIGLVVLGVYMVVRALVL